MVKGYKKTEIGLLPQNWEVKTIGKISTPKARIGWQNLRKEEYMESGLYMLITGTDFEDGRVNYSTCKFVSENRYEQDPNIQVKNGNVLVTKDGTLGKVAIIKGLNFKATLNAGVFVLGNLSSSINNEFLYQYLSTNRLMKYAERTSTGGTIQHLNQGVLVDFPIPVPPVEEQARIAAALSDIDDLIIKSEELIKKYQTMKQGCLQHMFPRNGQTEPDMRLPGFSGAWEQRKLGEVATFINGRAYKQSELLNYGKYKVLRVGNFYTNDAWYYSNLELEDKYYIEKGDLVYTWSATFGPHIWNGEKVIYHYHIWKIKLSEYLDRDFTLQILEADKAKLLSSTNGSTMIHVTKDDMESKNIFLPSIDEQKKIGIFLMKIDNLIALHQRKREKYKMIKQGMMEDLLTGKVRLK